jgi:hypothetical protein
MRFALPFALAVLPLAVSAAAQSYPALTESDLVFLPSDAAVGEVTVEKGDDFLSVPLRWAFAGSLAADVDVAVEGGKVTLRAGEVLPQVRVPGSGYLQGPRSLLCTRNKVVEKRNGGSPFGQLLDSIRDSLRDAQYCVEDTDKDGLVDVALVLGKRREELRAAPITPTAVTWLTDAVIPGDGDRVTFGLAWITTNRTRLDVNIVQRGTPRLWDTFENGRFSASSLYDFQHADGFPSKTRQFGVEITLVSSDKKGKTATFGWRSAVGPGVRIVVPREVDVTYGY